MQDKEFDDLFRSKLDNFETEPSAEVWQNIDAELGGRKKKRIFPILSIAASVLIVLTAGILFIPKKGVVKHNPIDTNNIAANKTKPVVVKPGNVNPVTAIGKKEELMASVQTPDEHVTSTHQTKVIAPPVEPKQKEQRVIAKEVPIKPEQQPVLAVVDTRVEDISKPIELDSDPTAIKHADDNSAISLPAQPGLVSTPIPPNKGAKQVVKKRGIRNFGDLVNLVVAKVDKRKDKLIQFTDTDDDESMISAVHLGALKIKKDN